MAKKACSEAHECSKEELNFHSIPATQTVIHGSYFEEHNPIASISDDSAPIIFMISGSSDDFTDLSSIYYQPTFRIFNADGKTDLVAADEVGPLNLLLHSHIQQIDVSLNGVNICPPSGEYRYKAYLKRLLTFSKEAKDTWLKIEGWKTDQMGAKKSLDDFDNSGLVARAGWTALSKALQLYGRLDIDMAEQPRLIPNKVDIQVKLHRMPSAFCLMAKDEKIKYKMKITQAKLFVRKVVLTKSAALNMIKQIEQSNFKYPHQRTEVKGFTMAKSINSKTFDNVFNGHIPTKVFVALVELDAYNGQYAKNGFNFKNFSMQSLSLVVNGQQIPATPIEPDFDEHQLSRAYALFQDSVGVLNRDFSNGIDVESWANGNTVYGIDLTPDLSMYSCDHISPYKEGTVNLNIKLKKDDTRAALQVLVMGCFNSIIEIDRNRNVLLDY